MHSDHRQPGSTSNRATVASPRCATLPIVLSGLRGSSGLSMLLDSAAAILHSLVRWWATKDPPAPNARQGPAGATAIPDQSPPPLTRADSTWVARRPTGLSGQPR